MRQVRALMLGAAIGIMAPIGAAGRAEPIQAQNQAPPPGGFRIIGNIHWVGGEYGSYLITTPQGHILHDTGTSEMHDVIVSNVKKLGFDVKDIKMIISSHAHFDHVQGHAAMKKLTGAQVIALGGDAAALEAGQDNSAGGRPPCGQPASPRAAKPIRSHSAAEALTKSVRHRVADFRSRKLVAGRLALFQGSSPGRIVETPRARC